ncbi:MAG: 2-oxo acid dehydrogenase subunit E2 [Solirubrobacteraceae bacterium]
MHGIELGALAGSGPRGRVTRRDVALAAGLTLDRDIATATPAPPALGDRFESVTTAAPRPALGDRFESVTTAAPRPPALGDHFESIANVASGPSAAPVPLALGDRFESVTTGAPTSTPTPKPAPTPAAGDQVRALSRLQRVVAERMARTQATVPDFQVETEVCMDAALALRAEFKAAAPDGEPAPSINDLVVKASALALRLHPLANGSFGEDGFRLHEQVNVGIAVAAQDALIVPTITAADVRSLGSIAAEARRLSQRVRAGTIAPDQLSGATFTVSNLGMYGMTAIKPVVNMPQAAILGVGATRAVLARDQDGEIVDRSLLTLTLSCDHRILYGADAARFLAEIRQLLERPLRLAL